MQITIYLDVIFFINFITDLFVLFLTGQILKQKIVMWRLIAGAVFGSISLLPFLCFPMLLFGKHGVIICTGISMGAVLIAFGRKNGGIIKKWFLSTTIMVLLGGLMNYFKYKTDSTTLTLFVWLGIFTGSVLLCTIVIHFLQRMLHKENSIYFIEVRNGKCLKDISVYLDTGNMLFDPLYGKPVILLSENAVKGCLEEEEKNIIQQYNKNGRLDFEKMMALKVQQKDSFHEIVYQSVGNPTGRLICFLADEVRVKGSEKILKRQPIAIISSALFEGKEYQGLLHRECV